MSERMCCWNCKHCDTFGGVCFKGKFANSLNKINLAKHSCDEFCSDETSSYNRLYADVARLTQENAETKQIYNERLDDLDGVLLKMCKINDKLKQENEQLREALKKCDPWTKVSHDDIAPLSQCEFCEGLSYEHKSNCEYIRLIGGDNND